MSSPGEFESFSSGIRERYESFTGYSQPNQAVTEQDLIEHVLRLLVWRDYLPQQGSARSEDIPDLLLFPDAGAKERAVAREVANQRYLDAVAVGESKRLGLALDARDGGQQASRTPHGQILRYLATAEIECEGRIRWGILTSGDVWRLYYSRARPPTGYLEVALAAVLESGGVDALRVFHLLFRRESFVLREGATSTFLQAALDEGKRYSDHMNRALHTGMNPVHITPYHHIEVETRGHVLENLDSGHAERPPFWGRAECRPFRPAARLERESVRQFRRDTRKVGIPSHSPPSPELQESDWTT